LPCAFYCTSPCTRTQCNYLPRQSALAGRTPGNVPAGYSRKSHVVQQTIGLSVFREDGASKDRLVSSRLERRRGFRRSEC